MEDFQEQEYEFLRKLEEEKIGRKTLLKRGLAAGAGLTVMSLSPAALAARSKALADPPTIGRLAKLSDIVAAAKKEGRLNVIALPPDWANYGEIISTFSKKYGIPITSDNPDASSAQENQAIRSLKGDSRAPDVLDVSASQAQVGANEGLYAKYFTTNFRKVPRAMKDGRGFWVGDYWGVVSFGVNRAVISNPPKSWKDLLKPEYKNKVALNGSPLSSGSAVAGVFSASIANGGGLSNIQPGIDFFAQLKSVGNFLPVQATPQTIASGQTPITIDWDYLNLAYGKNFPASKIQTVIPSDAVYGAYYCQAINATAPASVGSPALAGVPLLRPGPAALAEGVLAPGVVHRHGRPQGRAERADQGAAERSRVLEGQVRERRRRTPRPGRRSRRSGPRRSARSPLSTMPPQARPLPARSGGPGEAKAVVRLARCPAVPCLRDGFPAPAGRERPHRCLPIAGRWLDARQRRDPLRGALPDRVQEQHRGEPRNSRARRAARAHDRLLGDP